MVNGMRIHGRGFTLIELLVVLSIVALLLSIVAPRMMHQTDRAREVALKQNLATLRMAIDRYKADKGEYPPQLSTLVEQHYLRQLPTDPVTERDDTWKVVSLDEHGEPHVYDVHSGASGTARDGSAFSSW